MFVVAVLRSDKRKRLAARWKTKRDGALGQRYRRCHIACPPAHQSFVVNRPCASRVTNEDMVEQAFRLRATSHCRKLIRGPVIRGVVIWIQRKRARGRFHHLVITTTLEGNG